MRYMTSLRFIDAVAREGSIRKAADKLAITSTALNRRILAIEDELGRPSSSSIARILRLSAVEVMASLSAAFRMEPSRATASMNRRLVIYRMQDSSQKTSRCKKRIAILQI